MCSISLPAYSAVLYRNLHRSPIEVVSASGLYFTCSDGRKIVDATGGAAVSCIGHGDARVQKAMTAQTQSLDYIHSMIFSCPVSEDLCKLLVDSTDGAMAKAYILSSGSEAMEAAMKLARQYFVESSQPQRIRFIARKQSYHGNTLGALGLSGHKVRRNIYEPMLSPLISHISPCYEYRGRLENERIEDYVDRLAAELDEEFQRVGPETVCAFVAEPVVGAALGCVPSVPGYLQAMKAVCDKYGALLIHDEVMCGMGRTGTLHAWQQEGAVPDIQTMGKGLGGGYAPVAGLLINHRVVDVLAQGTGVFQHGQTYQSHPLACAAALKVQQIIQEDGLLENVKGMGKYLEEELKRAFSEVAHVGNVRGRGLFWGLEFVEDTKTKKAFPAQMGIAMRVHDKGLLLEKDLGIMLYPGTGTVDGAVGDHILVAPPYNVSREEVDMIVRMIKQAVEEALDEACRNKGNDTSIASQIRS